METEKGPLNQITEGKAQLLDLLLSPKRYVTTVPTHEPRNFWEQVVFYDDGTSRRVYYYFNGSWSYTELT
jgi:hypothetical protein